MVSGISRVNWVGLFAPAGTPAPIVKKLESLSMEFAGSPEMEAYTASHGSVANPGTGAELGKSVVADQLLWKQMISAAGLQPE
jgi:tripartite-type tricarboxylate transporter receptor subunit TctC